MEFEDQEDQEEEQCMSAAAFDPTRMKLPLGPEAVMAAQPVRTSTNGGSGRARYRECLKNHAVGIGGHALDGCGEFMAAGTEGSLDALKCAACSCHRNFHRKESDGAGASVGGVDPFLVSHHHLHHPPPPQFAAYYRTPTGYLQVGGRHALLGRWRCRRRPAAAGRRALGRTRRTFRTRVQEERGWRIQKHDEGVVQAFCNETGVKRHVLKVWMHNNKHTLGKKP
ncbi:hypothetical protein ACSQ67_003582 [Phaseolus vulgaris]